MANYLNIKKLSFLFLLFVFTYGQSQTSQSTTKLYPVQKNGLYGFINQKGEEIIKAQYRNAGEFSEGLAPVRLEGTFGYIDEKGSYAVESKFDIAYPFVEGKAKVYIDGKGYLIDKKGTILLQHPYQDIFNTVGNRYIVETIRGKKGLVDEKGDIILDTLYKNTTPLNDDLFAAIKQNGINRSSRQVLVYDKNGKQVFENLDIEQIQPFKDGVAYVELLESGDEVFINEQGEVQFEIPNKWVLSTEREHFNDGKAIIDIYIVDRDTIKIWSSRNKYTIKGIIDTKGTLLFSNKDWREITAYKNNRAFAENSKGNWLLIDEKGEPVSNELYESVYFNGSDYGYPSPFYDEVAIVEKDDELMAIDYNGDLVAGPIYLDFDYDDLFFKDGILYIQSYNDNKEERISSYLYGFWDWKNNLLMKPTFPILESVSEDGTWNVIQNDKSLYFDKNGHAFWETKLSEKKSSKLNIDYMMRGYFYASSPYKEELAGFGGWGGSHNEFKKIQAKDMFPKEQFNLIVHKPTQRDTGLEEKSKLYIVNNREDTIYFNAQDSRLYLLLQAKDKQGVWKDIEYLPSSWCGNSYHTLFLPKNHYWEFAIPEYEGSLQTQLRAKLWYKPTKDSKDSEILYSEEFAGSVNPGQFWNKLTYIPFGLMDPYDE